MSGRLYKILYVDDEYWSREKIRTMIDWGDYDLEFLTPASDGDEALERMEVERPDILITDIDMPNMGGVELVDRVRADYPETITFIVSGYDDFEYVRGTMKSGAINYLIKPVTRMELVGALSEALEIIHVRQAADEEKRKQQAELLRASSLLQDREYSYLIDRVNGPETQELSLSMNLDVAGYSLILIKIHNMKKAMADYHQDINQISYTIKKKIREILDMDGVIVFNHVSKSNEFILISAREKARSAAMAEKYMNKLQQMLGTPVSVVISDYTCSMESIHKAYVQAVALLMTRRYRPESEIVRHTNDTEHVEEGRTLLLDGEVEDQIRKFVKLGNRKMVKELIWKKTGLASCGDGNLTYLDVKQTVMQIHNLLLPYDGGMASEDMVELENLMDAAEKSIELLDFRVLREMEDEVIDYILTGAAVEETESMRGIVRQVRSYVDAHYCEELSLSLLAERFAVESSYLSKCFKQETGENLIVYIVRRRMEKAREHIRENKVSLTEISFLVGYDDYTYFNRVFRKTVGMSPRDYKQQTVGADGDHRKEEG